MENVSFFLSLCFFSRIRDNANPLERGIRYLAAFKSSILFIYYFGGKKKKTEKEEGGKKNIYVRGIGR